MIYLLSACEGPSPTDLGYIQVYLCNLFSNRILNSTFMLNLLAWRSPQLSGGRLHMICSKCSHIPQSLLLNHCYGFLFVQLEESIVELAHIIMEHYVSESRVVIRLYMIRELFDPMQKPTCQYR